MSEHIKHECGIALVRLLKPLEYYQQKYGTWTYGLKKIYLLMEKQHNRGQDGAGLISVKLDSAPGKEYLHRVRSNQSEPIRRIFNIINKEQNRISHKNKKLLENLPWVENNLPFAGELLLGHLRYGTFGKNEIENVHPVLRTNNWKSKTLALAGNFNLTNVDEVFAKLLYLGQHPRDYSDTVSVLENVGHFLDEENEQIFRKFKSKSVAKKDCSPKIQENLDIINILNRSSKRWDGGYVIAGLIGHGDAFVTRDPWGIRPAYYYFNDEIAIVASERPVIQTALNLTYDDIKELKPGYAIIIKKNGTIIEELVREPQTRKACSFERIYFSRGGDKDIYNERKKLGELITPKILQTIDYDLDNTVFSYIPNTAETAFFGMIKALEDYQKEQKVNELLELGTLTDRAKIAEIIRKRPRVEKLAIKDIKLRTFITQDKSRDDLVHHVYDITYGTINEGKDNLVVIDDSIVRGTTLKVSIIRILDRLKPKQIIIVSSSPQIRYPDCYGIDMAKLEDFVAFQATIELLKQTNQIHIIDDVYKKSKAQEGLPKEEIVNYVKEIYAPFTDDQISDKISELIKSKDVQADVKVLFQTVENLHEACPLNMGDWYFTGNYPTPGGNKVVNTAFINYIEKKNKRAY